MNGEHDDDAILRWARATVTRYARETAWEVGEDALDDGGWRAVFVSEFEGEDGPAEDRLHARRPAGAFHTSLVFEIELDATRLGLRQDDVGELAAQADLAVQQVRKKGELAVLEVSARIHDAGLNRETFEATVNGFLDLRDAAQALLAEQTG